MVSLRQKRFNNVYVEISTEDEESDCSFSNNSNKNQIMRLKTKRDNSSSLYFQTKRAKVSFSDYEKKMLNTERKPKAFNKNALMARENRIKKKMYLQNLEETVEKYRDENKKLSSILNNQSTVISDLRKEVKYLKNVLANSTDIGVLLKSINQNTGLPVATSINNNIKMVSTKNTHPWSEEKPQFFNDLNFDENGECTTSLISDLENNSTWNDLFSDILSSPLNKEETSDNLPEKIQTPTLIQHNEHNYTNNLLATNDEDVGVCLHVSRHKVSLEFCSSCAENASYAWSEN